MQPYFLLALSVIGSLILVGISLQIGSNRALARDIEAVSLRVGGHGEKLVEISVTLVGPTGDNGINGEVKHLRRRMDDWDRRIGSVDRRHAS